MLWLQLNKGAGVRRNFSLLSPYKHTKAETKWPNFLDVIFKCIFLNENVWISIKISLKFVPKGPINNIQALVQIMAQSQPGDEPLSEALMVRLSTHMHHTALTSFIGKIKSIMAHTTPLSFDFVVEPLLQPLTKFPSHWWHFQQTPVRIQAMPSLLGGLLFGITGLISELLQGCRAVIPFNDGMEK